MTSASQAPGSPDGGLAGRITISIGKGLWSFLSWCWEKKWSHGPAYFWVWVLVGSTDPVGSFWTYAFMAITCRVLMRWPNTLLIRNIGRPGWWALSLGHLAAMSWLWVIAMAPMPVWLSALTLIAALWYPSRLWRKARPGGEKLDTLEKLARRILKAWPDVISGSKGPDKLRGSHIIKKSVVVNDAISVTVQLDDQHTEDASSDTIRKALEVKLKLPARTVMIRQIQDDGTADRINISFAPLRSLEASPAFHPGHELIDGKKVSLAMCESGRNIQVGLVNAGTRNVGIVGAQGKGKGGTCLALFAPPILASREILLNADGKYGMSCPELHPLSRRLGRTLPEWEKLIAVTYAVSMARGRRYGKMGIKEWSFEATGDPSVRLLLDEVNKLNQQLPSAARAMVAHLAKEGRSMGVSLALVGQSFLADDLPGGVPTRQQLAENGIMVLHRIGSDSGTGVASDGQLDQGVRKAVQTLPSGEGNAGFAVVLQDNVALSLKCRVYHAAPHVIEATKTFFATDHSLADFGPEDMGAAVAAGYMDDHWFDDDIEAEETAAVEFAPGVFVGSKPVSPSGRVVDQLNEIVEIINNSGRMISSSDVQELMSERPSDTNFYNRMAKLREESPLRIHFEKRGERHYIYGPLTIQNTAEFALAENDQEGEAA